MDGVVKTGKEKTKKKKKGGQADSAGKATTLV